MALHIVPANELHQANTRCGCRPRKVPYARRAAWRHNPARPVRSRATMHGHGGATRFVWTGETAPAEPGQVRELAGG